jgi:hypothetical protein
MPWKICVRGFSNSGGRRLDRRLQLGLQLRGEASALLMPCQAPRLERRQLVVQRDHALR